MIFEILYYFLKVLLLINATHNTYLNNQFLFIFLLHITKIHGICTFICYRFFYSTPIQDILTFSCPTIATNDSSRRCKITISFLQYTFLLHRKLSLTTYYMNYVDVKRVFLPTLNSFESIKYKRSPNEMSVK